MCYNLMGRLNASKKLKIFFFFELVFDGSRNLFFHVWDWLVA